MPWSVNTKAIASLVKTPSVCKAIAEEERHHIEYISAQLAALNAGVEAPSPELPKTGFFADRAESQNIMDAVAETMVAGLPVLRMAYLIERDFAEFSAMAAGKSK